MSYCDMQASGAVELYFYGELEPAERDVVRRHLSACPDCRQALEEMHVIREALASRPDVSAPPDGDWTGFMARLDTAVGQERRVPRLAYAGYLAMAALLALVTISVVFVAQSRDALPGGAGDSAANVEPAPVTPVTDPTLTSAGAEHLERSKLVVLGLAAKDAQEAADWQYERELAASLLNDTKLYRITAEQRGLSRLAGVLRDLELVLLQTSLAEETGPDSLEQIQRLIRKRDLVEKMYSVDNVTTAGS